MQTATAVIRELKKRGTAQKAEASRWFFKTEKGAYGEHDVFCGVTVPEQRLVAKQYKSLPLSEIQKLLQSKIHECRLTALIILANQAKRASEKTRGDIAKFYLSNTKHVNNWDLVDTSARDALGTHLLRGDRKVLYKLARSKNLWERRIAIIATQAFIAQHDFSDTLKIAKVLLHDKHDLIHKAVGWMLREVGNRAPEVEKRFLDGHAKSMPRTMLRYAIEKFPERERKKYLQVRY